MNVFNMGTKSTYLPFNFQSTPHQGEAQSAVASEPEDGLQPAVSRDQPRGAAAPQRGGAGHAAALPPPRPAHGAQRGPGPVQEPLPGDNPGRRGFYSFEHFIFSPKSSTTRR